MEVLEQYFPKNTE